MSEKLSRLEEKKLRRWIRRILVEDGGNEKALLTEDWDDFWGPSVGGDDFTKTFIEIVRTEGSGQGPRVATSD